MSRADTLAAMFAETERDHYRSIPTAHDPAYPWEVQAEHYRSMSDAELAAERAILRTGREHAEAQYRAMEERRAVAFSALRAAMEDYIAAAGSAERAAYVAGYAADEQHTLLAEVLRRRDVAEGNIAAAAERLATLPR